MSNIQQFVITRSNEKLLRQRIQKKGDISKIINKALEQYLATTSSNELSNDEKLMLEVFAQDHWARYKSLEEPAVIREVRLKYTYWPHWKIQLAAEFVCSLKRN